MPLPILIVGDVQGDHERLAGALVAYPEDEFETIFLGDFFTGGRPGDAGGHRAARIAMGRRHSRAILGNHDLLVMALVEEGRYGGERLRARDGELLETIWRRRRGDPADLEGLGGDPELEAWLRHLPVMLLLDDGTLVQHTDDDDYAALGDSVEQVNAAAAGPAGPGTRGRGPGAAPRDRPARLRRPSAAGRPPPPLRRTPGDPRPHPALEELPRTCARGDG